MRGRSAFLDPTDVQGTGFEADLIYQPERRNRTRLRSSCTLSSLPPFFLDIRHAILASFRNEGERKNRPHPRITSEGDNCGGSTTCEMPGCDQRRSAPLPAALVRRGDRRLLYRPRR